MIFFFNSDARFFVRNEIGNVNQIFTWGMQHINIRQLLLRDLAGLCGIANLNVYLHIWDIAINTTWSLISAIRFNLKFPVVLHSG